MRHNRSFVARGPAMRRVRHLRPCPPAARLATTNPLERQPSVRFERALGCAGAPTWTPSVTPTGSRPIREESTARRVEPCLHLDSKGPCPPIRVVTQFTP